MIQQPIITLSSLDLQRLEDLLDSMSVEAVEEQQALIDELNRARVVNPEDVPPRVVTMNSRVRFRVEPEGKVFERTLVYPSSMDGNPDKISVLAPVGSALLGLSAGDSIRWYMPRGEEVTVRVMDILYQPEAGGEFHR